MSQMIFDKERVDYKRLSFIVKRTSQVCCICCDNYKVEKDNIYTYLNGNLTSIIPIICIDMESLLYE
jgi:hypothetical protein